jgi:dihydropteroate synthase
MSMPNCLEPIGLVSGALAKQCVARGQARWLAGGPFAFTGLMRHVRGGACEPVALEAADAEALARLAAKRPDFGGLSLDRPRLMGIVNVTPDSFSDGGESSRADEAIARGLAWAEAGADIIDVGGESTRPGAEPVDAAEERRRVLPVVRALAAAKIRVSIDTRHAEVMQAALDAGAAIINDVSGLAGDPGSLRVAVEAKVPVVLMHMRGEPRTMQAAAQYEDVVLDVHDELAARVAACLAAGIAPANIAIDPGIGFAKTAEQNLPLIAHLAVFHGLGLPILVGVSRKGFIGRLSGVAEPKERGPGSLAAGLACLARGAQLLRVHDVAATAQAVKVWRGLVEA